eukprot:scaffold4545_cov58-Phaeocystis_antarctica.AAC.6
MDKGPLNHTKSKRCAATAPAAAPWDAKLVRSLSQTANPGTQARKDSSGAVGQLYSWRSATAGQSVAPCSVAAGRIGVEHRRLGVHAVRAAGGDDACRSVVHAFEASHCQPIPAGRFSHRHQALLLSAAASRTQLASGVATAPSTRVRSISWRSADTTPSSRRVRYFRKTFWARRAMHCSFLSFSGLSSDCTQLIVASALSLSEQPRPPPKRTVWGQLIAFGKGRLGIMSSAGAISTGRHPAAIASNRRREVGVSPAGTRHIFEFR